MSEISSNSVSAAYEALSNLEDLAFIGADSESKEGLVSVWKDLVQKVLPPRPQPTMADIAWDDDECYLAGVENRIWGHGIMLYLDDERDTILCQFQQEGEPFTLHCELDTLTPTDKKYKLVEQL